MCSRQPDEPQQDVLDSPRIARLGQRGGVGVANGTPSILASVWASSGLAGAVGPSTDLRFWSPRVDEL
jgi:hypothetical protein